MPASVTLKAMGLVVQPNQLDPQSVPPGSLTVANNVIIRRDNVIESRRGYQLYGNAMGSTTDRADQLAIYLNRIIRHYSNQLQYDSDGNGDFLSFAGTYLEAQQGRRMRFLESNGNLYFTSSDGIQKISGKTITDLTQAPGFIVPAGAPQALNLTGVLDFTLGNQTGFLPQDSAVAYRVVWGYTDANNNVILGAPSAAFIIYNPLQSLQLTDLNNLLVQLDNVSNSSTPSLITLGDYYALFNLPSTASAAQILTNLEALAAQLDENIVYANQTASAPLQISDASIDNGVATISFSSGDPTQYLISSDNINIEGFTPATGTLNGPQVVATVFPAFTTTGNTNAGVEQVTQVTTVADVGGNLAGTYWTIDSANDATQYYIWYNVSGSGISPSLPGKTGIQVNIITGDTANDVATKTVSAILAQSVDFSIPFPGANVITITNIADGPAFNAGSGTTGFTVTVTVPGIIGNTVTSLASTSGIQIGTFVTDTGGAIPVNTYVVSIGIASVVLSNSVTASLTGDTINFQAGISFTPEVVAPAAAPTGPVTTVNATINSYNYEAIVQPGTPNTPPTDAQLVAIQTYMQAIITQLQSEPGTVIAPSSQTFFISPIQLTESANVTLTFPIPAGITSNYFYQVYRSQIFSASGVQVLETDVIPNDELQLVIEAFPTPAQLAARVVVVTDSTPPEFAGAFLYTNQNTGQGILQANNLPPFALDINKFKNVVFYANTKTLFNQQISLLGVQQIINAFNNLLITTITNISVGNPTTITTAAPHGLTTGNIITILGTNSTPSADGSWTVTVTGANTFTIPLHVTVAGNTGFLYGGPLPSITITNGVLTNTYTFVTGLQEEINVATVADVAGSLASKYFTFNNADNTVPYYVYYIVNGVGVDPMIAGATAIPVFLNTNASANTVATLTSNAIGIYNMDFVTSASTNNITIENVNEGQTNAPSAATSGFTITVTQIGRGANPALNQILLSTVVSPAQAVQLTAQSLVNAINTNPNESVYAYYISGINGVPGQIELQSRDLSSGPFYILANGQAVGASFNPNISPDFTITNISATDPTVITTSAPHGFVNQEQVVIGGSNSVPSIDGLYTITYISPTTFSIPVAVTIAGNAGVVSSADFTLTATNDVKANRIYYSKLLQPEAVPIVNFIDVGDQTQPILRIFPLRDSLFVYKADGLFRISGEAAPFNLAIFDSSCILIAADSLDLSNNALYGWTTQGITSTTESGVSTISRAIDTQILPLATAQYVNFDTATWGIGYESDNSYTVYTITQTTDVIATIAYRYSTLTNSWTNFLKTENCGIINPFDDRQYLGAGDTNFLEQERKNFDRTDYADRQFVTQLTGGNYYGTQLQLTSLANIAIGDVITQDQFVSIYLFNQLLEKLDTDPDLSPHTYVANNTMLPGTDGREALDNLLTQIANDPGRLAQPGATSADDYLALQSILTLETITNISATDPTVITTSTANGLQTGRVVEIAGSNTVPSVDGLYQVTVLTPTTFTIPLDVTTPETTMYSIVDISVANPTIITTSIPNNLITGNSITITGSNSTPNIDGTHTVTVLSPTTFSIPVDVTVEGSAGTFVSSVVSYTVVNDNFLDVQSSYNSMIALMNNDLGFGFHTYVPITNDTLQEAIVTSINPANNRVTLNNQLDWIIGPLTVYAAIDSLFQYAPVTFGNPMTLKHVREATLIFENRAFTNATLSFSSDLLPAFQDVNFAGSGVGIFGYTGIPATSGSSPTSGLTGPTGFGYGFFGGIGNAAPMRTYVPRDLQRCRFLNCQFSHMAAREQYAIFGLTLYPNDGSESTRGYR